MSARELQRELQGRAPLLRWQATDIQHPWDDWAIAIVAGISVNGQDLRYAMVCNIDPIDGSLEPPIDYILDAIARGMAAAMLAWKPETGTAGENQ